MRRREYRRRLADHTRSPATTYAPRSCAARGGDRSRHRRRDRGSPARARAGAATSTTRTARPTPTPAAKPATYPLDSTLRLNQIQVLGSHNSYHGQPYPQVLARAEQGRHPAVRAGLDYGHRPLARAVPARCPPDRARRVVRSQRRQVRAPVVAEVARPPAARPGRDEQARVQGHPRGEHRHALDVPHVRAAACAR